MPHENLESRVTALEVQVGDLRSRVRASEHDAAAARVLAGGADRDVGEIRGEIRDFQQATIGSFNALRADMVDGFRRVDEKFAQVDNGFAEMRAKFDMTTAGQQRIVALIQTVIDAQGDNGSV
jgi:hypothetical protein